MLPRRVIRIADRSIAILEVDSELTPDITLADVDIFLLGEEPLIVSGEESRDDRIGAIRIADHFRDLRSAS